MPYQSQSTEIQQALASLVAISRSHELCTPLFAPENYPSLPSQLTPLSTLTLPPDVIIGAPTATHNPLFHNILTLFYTISFDFLQFLSNQTSTPESSDQSSQSFFNNFGDIIRVLNNLSQVDGFAAIFFNSPVHIPMKAPATEAEQSQYIIPNNVLHIFSTLTALLYTFRLKSNSTSDEASHTSSNSQLLSAILSPSFSPLFLAQVTTVNVSSLVSSCQLATLQKLHSTAIQTILTANIDELDQFSKKHIESALFSGLLSIKFHSLSFSTQLLYQHIITTLSFIYSTLHCGHCDQTDGTAAALAQIESHLQQLYHLTSIILPTTSSSESYAFSLSHPFMVNVHSIFTELFALFFTSNWAATIDTALSLTFSTLIDGYGRQEMRKAENTDDNNAVPKWGVKVLSQSPTLLSFFYLLINAMETSEGPKATGQCTEKKVISTPIRQQLHNLLLNSIPLLTSTVSEFNINQYQAFYNDHINSQQDAANLLGQAVSPSTAPVNAQPDPKKAHLVKVKAQMVLNTQATLFYVTMTPLLTKYSTHLRNLRCSSYSNDLATQDRSGKLAHSNAVVLRLFNDHCDSFADYAYSTLCDDYGVIEDLTDEDVEENQSKIQKSVQLAEYFGQRISTPQSLWDHEYNAPSDLALLKKSQQGIGSEAQTDDEEGLDEDTLIAIHPHTILTKFNHLSQSPLCGIQSIISSVTVMIMSLKFINTISSSSGHQATPQQPQVQSQQIVADDSTPLLHPQSHFNFLVRYLFPFIYAEVIETLTMTSSVLSQLYSYQISPQLSAPSTTLIDTSKQLTNFTAPLLQSLLQRYIVLISDVFTSIAPITLSALQCQLLLHNIAPLQTIFHFIHHVTSYFLHINSTIAVPLYLSAHSKSQPDVQVYNSPLPLLHLFNTYYLSMSTPNSSEQTTSFTPTQVGKITFTPLTKLLSSLCYRGITLLAYFVGNALPSPIQPIHFTIPAQTQASQELTPTQLFTPSQSMSKMHPQQKMVIESLVTPEFVAISLFYVYYYLKFFIFTQVPDQNLQFAQSVQSICNSTNCPTATTLAQLSNIQPYPNKKFFQYQLVVQVTPPILEVIEGNLTMLLNGALYFQRQPPSQGQLQKLYNFQEQYVEHVDPPEILPFQINPLSLICSGTIFDFLLRLLTLGWDGDNDRFEKYTRSDQSTEDGVVDFITPGAKSQGKASAGKSLHDQSNPAIPQMTLIQELFHQLYATSCALANRRNQLIFDKVWEKLEQHDKIQSTEKSSPTIPSIIPNPLTDSKVSQLDFIPGHVLQLKLPTLQITVLRLLRTTFDALTQFHLHNLINRPKSSQSPQAFSFSSTPHFFNTFSPLKCSEFLTSLYALSCFCPISTLQYEAARVFAQFCPFFYISFATRFSTPSPSLPVLSPQAALSIRSSSKGAQKGKDGKKVQTQDSSTVPGNDTAVSKLNNSALDSDIVDCIAETHVRMCLEQTQSKVPPNTSTTFPGQFFSATSFNLDGIMSAEANPTDPANTVSMSDLIALISLPTFTFAKQTIDQQPIPIQDPQCLVFQQLLKILLSVNTQSPDGQLLINEAHAALRALGFAQ